jgi:preprotein translocase subunit YajC
MFGLMYLLLIRPQRSQQRRHQDLLKALKVGDEVITAGGIYGDVVGVEDDKVHVLIAEDVEIEVARRSIATVLPPDTADVVVDDEAEDDEPAADEPEATAVPAGDGALAGADLEEAGRTRGAQPRRED